MSFHELSPINICFCLTWPRHLGCWLVLFKLQIASCIICHTKANKGERRLESNNQMSHLRSTPSTTNGNVQEDQRPPKKGWRKFFECIGNCLTHKDKGKWLKDMRGNLSLVATLIATMTFQFAVNPPGGVVQVGTDDHFVCSNRTVSRGSTQNTTVSVCPGEAVLAAVYPNYYFKFFVFNTISFVASMSVCLLLVSGFPLNHSFTMWLLSIGMCITVTCLAVTYMYGTIMVTPANILGSSSVHSLYGYVLLVWVGLLAIIALILKARFLVWVVKKCIKKRSKSGTEKNNTRNISANAA